MCWPLPPCSTFSGCNNRPHGSFGGGRCWPAPSSRRNCSWSRSTEWIHQGPLRRKEDIADRSHSRAAGTQGASNAAAKYELRTRHGFGIFKHQEERWVTMKRRLVATIMCVVFVLLVLSGGAPQLSAQSTGKWKVAFPQVGPVGD